MHDGEIHRILITHEQIARRVRELAGQITADHASNGSAEPVELIIIPILTGAMIFAADLIRHLPMKMRIGLLTVSSYPGASTRSKGASLLSQDLADVRGRNVLIVDDILDSGGTLALVRGRLEAQSPASLRTCVLLRKPTPGAKRAAVDYVGFEIPNEFVVGYGLDFNNYYRNLPDIVTLRPDIIAGRVGVLAHHCRVQSNR